MPRSLEDSLELFNQIKAFFAVEYNTSLVIQIDEQKPMSQWKTKVAHTVEQRFKDRCLARTWPEGFAAFAFTEEGKNFGFFDYNLVKVEDLQTGQMEFFNTYEADDYDLEMAAGDFKGFLAFLEDIKS
jgi:hypothetical protein